jgi:ferredoxin
VVNGGENLVPPTALEKRLMTQYGFRSDERAACLAKVKGDVTITTTYW